MTPGRCEICGTPLRSDNRSGLCCTRRSAACTTERRRRERAAAGVRCLCSDPRTDHPGDGKCSHRACGCDWYRLDYRSRIEPEPGESAATEGAA
jgi:hypothetical protein